MGFWWLEQQSMSDASMSNAAVHDLVQQLDDTALYNILVFELPNKAAALE